MSTATLEDYKKYVRELKTRIKHLTESNTKLKEDLEKAETLPKPTKTQDPLIFLLKANKASVLIQKYVRGFLARRKMAKSGKASTIVAKARQIDLKISSENEMAIQDLFKSCSKLGLNLEMVYRISDVNRDMTVTKEEFSGALNKLKLNLTKRKIDILVSIFDEANQGVVVWEDYCATLFAYNACSEPLSAQIARNHLATVLDTLKESCDGMENNPFSIFKGEKFNRNDFVGVLENIQQKTGQKFYERDSDLLFNHFDRKKTGFVEKKAINLDAIIATGPVQSNIESRLEKGNEAVIRRGPISIKRVHVIKIRPESSRSKSSGDAYPQVVKNLEKQGPNLGGFFDKFAEFLQAQKPKVTGRTICLNDFSLFVSNYFGEVLGDDLIESWCNEIPPARNPTSNFQKQPPAKKPKPEEPQIDLIEMKNKILSIYGKKVDTNNFLKKLLATSLETQGVDTKEYFGKSGLNSNRKIEFPEFYLAAQKLFGSNYHESLSIFESIDKQKQRCISVATLCDEIDEIRGKTPAKIHSDNSSNKIGANFEEVRRKMLLGSLNLMERIVQKIQESAATSAKSLDRDQTNKIFKSCLLDTLTDDEMNLLLERISPKQSCHVDLYELLDFMVDNFSAKREVAGFYMKVVAGYLDKNFAGQSTEQFFRDKKMHPLGLYDKSGFESKIRQIFGFTQNHCELFFDQFKDKDLDTISMAEFIKAIDKNRKKMPTLMAKPENQSVVPKTPQKVDSRPSTPQKSNKKDKENSASKLKIISLQRISSKPQIENPKVMNSKPQFPPPPNPPKPAQETQKSAKKLPQPAPSSENKPKNEIEKKSWTPHNVTDVLEEKTNFSPINRTNIDQIVAKMEKIKQSKLHELRHLQNYIEKEAENSLQILELKPYCYGLFDKPETQILLEAFFLCDKNKNGTVELSEWNEIENRLQLKERPPPPELPIKVPDFQTNEQVFTSLAQECNPKFKLPLEYLNEFFEYKSKPIPTILLNKHAQTFYGKKNKSGLEFFRKLLTFLDDDKNGFFSFYKIRFLILLMNLPEIRNQNKIEQLNYEFLKTRGLSLDVLRVFGSQMLDTFVRGSCLDFGAIDTSDKIDLFILAHNLSNCLPHHGDLEIVLNFIDERYRKKKELSVSTDELIRLIGAEPIVDSIWRKADSASLPANIHAELRKLRSLLVKTNGSQYAVTKLGQKDVSKQLAEFFKIDRNDKLDFDNFYIFLLFAKLPPLEEEKPSPKTKSMENLIFDAEFLLQQFTMDHVSRKLSNCNLTKEEITELIDGILSEREFNLNLLTFCSILEKLPLDLDKQECFSLFDFLDTKKEKKIKIDLFLEFFGTIQRKMASTKTQSLRATITTASEQKSIDLLKDMKLKSSDFYCGKKTILNSAMASLKIASQLVSELKPFEKFKDPDFGPKTEDPYGRKALYLQDPPPGYPEPEDLQWLRPDQISKSAPPKFVDGQARAQEVNQGAIGDCWLIAAMSQLAMNDEMFFKKVPMGEIKHGCLNDEQARDVLTGVYPSIFHFFAKYGLFVFRFFKDFDWKFVIIDDFLPCYNGDPNYVNLVFAHATDPSVFWVSLIEKAYAKLHGCYEALIGGQMEEGVVDMTGHAAEKLLLKNDKKEFNAQVLNSPEFFWKKLNMFLNEGSLLGCSVAGQKGQREADLVIKGEKTGLYCGHAYGLMDFLEINNKKIVRIRNPHGKENSVTWNGKFSNNTKELMEILPKLNEMMKQKWKSEAEEYHLGQEDGSFFMDYNDFLSIWQKVCVAIKFPKVFTGLRFFGEWDASNSGGTPLANTQQQFIEYGKNPQFIVDIKSERETGIFVSLSQEDGRVKSAGQERAPFPSFTTHICLVIMKLKPGENKVAQWGHNETMNTLEMGNSRSTQTDLKLKKGKYSIIPSTGQQGYFGKFFLSIYYDCPDKDIAIVDSAGRWKPSPIREEDESLVKFDDSLKRTLTTVLTENLANKK